MMWQRHRRRIASGISNAISRLWLMMLCLFAVACEKGNTENPVVDSVEDTQCEERIDFRWAMMRYAPEDSLIIINSQAEFDAMFPCTRMPMEVDFATQSLVAAWGEYASDIRPIAEYKDYGDSVEAIVSLLTTNTTGMVEDWAQVFAIPKSIDARRVFLTIKVIDINSNPFPQWQYKDTIRGCNVILGLYNDSIALLYSCYWYDEFPFEAQKRLLKYRIVYPSSNIGDTLWELYGYVDYNGYHLYYPYIVKFKAYRSSEDTMIWKRTPAIEGKINDYTFTKYEK